MSERITQEQIDLLISKHPKLLIIRDSDDFQYTRKIATFMCGGGWFDIIDATLTSVQKYIDYSRKYSETPVEQYKITAILEKCGNLMFYYTGKNPIIDHMLDVAMEMSRRICEISGQPGKLYAKDGWYKTLSKDLADMLGYEEDTYLIGDSSGAEPTTVTGA